MNVIEATNQAELQSAFALRYQVYRQLGRDYPGMDHENGLIIDDVDEAGRVFCLQDDGETVATIRGYSGTYTLKEYAEKIHLETFAPFGLDQVAILDRLVIREDYRNSAAAGILFAHLFNIALERGYRIGILDCAPHLVRLYGQLGFRQYTHGFYFYGYNIPLAFIMDDVDYVREISSPFLRALRKQKSTRATTEWFESTFPDFIARPTNQLPEKDLRQYIVPGVHKPPGEHSFLAGFSEEEALVVFRELAIIHGAAGDTIVSESEHSECMFCVSEGTLDSTVAGRSVETLHPGDTFGEMGFLANLPSSTAIRARTDCRLTVLYRKDFEKFEKQFPELAIRLQRNLFNILAHRFHKISTLWGEKNPDVGWRSQEPENSPPGHALKNRPDAAC